MGKQKSEEPLNVESSLNEVQRVIRERICNPQNLPENLLGLEDQKRNLLELIKRTAIIGESNSVLVIGPRGSGKTVLLQVVLQELWKNKEVKTNLLQVSLNGIVHTDDRIALKEITRQLQLETAASVKVFVSFSENLSFLLEALKSGDQNTKSVLFILDEFDLFAHHKNQTLLYNLFDASQSAQTPIIVVGLTCRLDVVELLEKRVKSRFSHRQIHLLNNYTFDDYVSLLKSTLFLKTCKDKKFASCWNDQVEDLCKNSVVLEVLQRQYDKTKDIRSLQSLLLFVVSKLDIDHSAIEAGDFIDAQKLQVVDSKAALLQGVSLLELSLIIAMNHLTVIYSEPFNFEMVYNVYQKFVQRKTSMQCYEKPVIIKTLEHLQTLEFLQPVSNNAARIQKEYRLNNLLIDSSQLVDALQKYPNLPVEVKQWAISGLI